MDESDEQQKRKKILKKVSTFQQTEKMSMVHLAGATTFGVTTFSLMTLRKTIRNRHS
jgi:hypothetical protein